MLTESFECTKDHGMKMVILLCIKKRLILILIIWLQDKKKNHTMRTCNGYARGRDLMSEIEENIQVDITFIRSICCLSFYNYLLLLNVQFIFGLNYHSLFDACWCPRET